jgi:hypothetical protein
MAKKKVAPKKSKKKLAAARKVAPKKKPTASIKKIAPILKKVAKAAAPTVGKALAKKKAAAKKKVVAKAKIAPKKKLPAPVASVSRGSQDVEMVQLKPKSRVARAGTGSGDLQGISIVEDVDSESADELLEEGQAFEAGIISGVERAGTETSEVITHEVLEDDVPKEYDDEDRP